MINSTRKDSCNNACVLLPLINSHRYSQVQPTPVVNWDNHALRRNAHQLCYISNTHGIISHRHIEFGRRYAVTCIVFDVPSPQISAYTIYF